MPTVQARRKRVTTRTRRKQNLPFPANTLAHPCRTNITRSGLLQGAGLAQYQVSYTNESFSLELVEGSARAIPEPGTLSLLGMAALLLRRWVQRARRVS